MYDLLESMWISNLRMELPLVLFIDRFFHLDISVGNIMFRVLDVRPPFKKGTASTVKLSSFTDASRALDVGGSIDHASCCYVKVTTGA